MFRTARGVATARDDAGAVNEEEEATVSPSVRPADAIGPEEGGRRGPPADGYAWSAASALSSVGDRELGGSSSWVTSDSVWNGTGSRVILCTSPSSSTYPSSSPSDLDWTAASHETRRSNSELSSADSSSDGSDDAGSDLTALAARPVSADGPASGAAAAGTLAGSGPVEVATATTAASGTLDETSSMITPGLHTAHLAGMSFDGQAAVSPPLTLAHYLASSLEPHASAPVSPVTSGKARSISSMSTTSLASYPTDAMSDFSRVDSLGDLEDLASLSEDDASAGSGRGQQRGRSAGNTAIRDSNAELVMPRLRAASSVGAASSASSAPSSESIRVDRGGQSRGELRASGQAAISQPALRILVVGSSDTDLPNVERLLHLPKGERKAPRASRPNVRSSPASSEESISDLLRNLSPASESSNDNIARHPAQCVRAPIVETTQDIDSASERVVKPFNDLRGVLRPNIVTEENELVHKLLPTLLIQAAAIDAVLLLLRTAPGESLAQHVAMRYTSIRRLSKLTTLVPVLYERLEGDAASHLTQGDIDFWGLDKRGELASLRQKGGAKVLSLTEMEVDLAAVLFRANVGVRVQQCYQRWAAPASIFEVSRPVYTRSGTALCGSRPSSSESKNSDLLPSDPPTSNSLSTGSASSGQSAMPSPTVGEAVELPVAQRIPAPPIWPGTANDTAPCVDPLHLPSLFRLMGISLAATFSRIRAGLSALLSGATPLQEVATGNFRPASPLSGSKRSSQNPDADTATSRSPSPANSEDARPRSPFIGCCKYRYLHGSFDGAGVRPFSPFEQMLRCKGLLIATCVFGIALFFS